MKNEHVYAWHFLKPDRRTPKEYKRVITHLSALGMSALPTKNRSANGVDIRVLSPAGDLFNVEVKRAFRANRCWKVGRVTKDRMRDDFIAIVFPSGTVHVEEMKTHLSACSKDGTRRVTKLAMLMALKPARKGKKRADRRTT